MKQYSTFMNAAVFREYNKDLTQAVEIEDTDMPKHKSNEIKIDFRAVWNSQLSIKSSS